MCQAPLSMFLLILIFITTHFPVMATETPRGEVISPTHSPSGEPRSEPRHSGSRILDLKL